MSEDTFAPQGDVVETAVDETVTDETDVEGLEADAELQAAVEPKKEEKKSNKRKLKLKVDGKEFDEEVDFDDEDYVIKQLQLAKVAQKRMQEKSALEKEVGSFLEELKKNPRKVLSDPRIGLDVKRLAAEIIEEEIQNSQKTPEQIEREQLESELKAMKEEREKEKEEARKREFDQIQQREFERYDMQMTKALEKSDLPKSPYIVKKMADYMLMGINQGMDVGPEDVLPLVREEMQNDLKEMFAAMPDEVVEALVGKDVIGRIRKKSVAKAKSAPKNLSQVKETGQKTEKAPEVKKKISAKEFFGI